jgi:hypothetical protein
MNNGMKDYYAVLQVAENADRKEIQKAYRRLALQYHPDVNKSPDAHEKFCEITEAYEFVMNHWPQHLVGHPETQPSRQEYVDYRQTEEYERFRHEAREKAYHQAKMRYERFKKQHEAFQESGINDIALIFTALIRLLSIPFFIALFFLPLVLSVASHWTTIFLAILMWPIAGFIAWYIYDNRKHYLIPGTFYYSPDRIRHLFSDTHPSDRSCYYCKSRPADSRPYIMELLKLKELRLKTGGFRQHNVNYINRNISIPIPRSRKAFSIHALNGLIKIISVLICLVFLPLSSIVWRLVSGMIVGGFASLLILTITNTRSNVSYLLSINMILRLVTWTGCLLLVSRFYLNPFNIRTSESIHFVVTAIIVFDCFLMQVIDLVIGKRSSKPVIRQFPEVHQKFNEGYVVYNDVPLLSVFYPVFKWIFG